MCVTIYDVSDPGAKLRGGGRILQILKENFPEARWVNNFDVIGNNDTLLVPSWSPFSRPLLNKRIARKQYLMIFDVIPLKYPSHFPAGIRGTFNLWRNKRALRYFDKIITISKTSKKDIMQHLNIAEDKIVVVYPTLGKIFLTRSVIAIPPKAEEAISKKIATSSRNSGTPRSDIYTKYQILNTKYVLYVGDVNWNKNLVNLAKAIKLADAPCVFVGKVFSENTKYEIQNTENVHPWQQEFKQFLTEVGDDPRFIFAGYVPDEELITLYKNAVCNILVSRDEGFGYSYAEAASQRCPSVLSDIDVFHETAGDTALFANPNDPSDIAEKIKTIVINKKLKNELVAKSHKRVQKLNFDDFSNKILNFLI